MTYTPDQITVEAYSLPIWESLGTFFSHFSEDKDYYRTLSQTVTYGFQTPWVILERQRRISNLRYGGQAFFWPSKQLNFKESESNTNESGQRRLLLPTDITSVRFLKNKLVNETKILTLGIDYYVEAWDGKNWLVLTDDIFMSTDFDLSSTLDENNEITDRELMLWGVEAFADIWPEEDQWGSWLKLQIRDTDRAASTQSVVNALATGPSFEHLLIGAGRAYGHPVCENDGEVVENVLEDRRGKLVITDKAVYRYPSEAVITVSEGDELTKCQSISSAVLWYDTTRGYFPNIAGWAVDKHELGSNYNGSLLFANEEKDLIVTSVADKTKVQVDLGGSLVDQETFWAEVHTRGVSGGTTLANYLDTRTNPVGEPSASDLPTTLNPFTLLMQESFIYATILCVLDYSQALNPAGAAFLSAWQKALPSHQAIKTFCQMGDSGATAPALSGTDPDVGLVFMGSIGYYGVGAYSSASGNPVIAQEA